MPYQLFPAEWEPYLRNQITSLYKEVMWTHAKEFQRDEDAFSVPWLLGSLALFFFWGFSWSTALMSGILLSFVVWHSRRMGTCARYYEQHCKQGIHSHDLEEAVQYFTMDTSQHELIREFLSALVSTENVPANGRKQYCGELEKVLDAFEDKPFIKNSPWFKKLREILPGDGPAQ